MKTINHCEIVGFVGRDAERKWTTASVRFSVATGNESRPSGGKTPLCFHNIAVWNRPELLDQVKKGTPVRVVGRLDYSKWTGTDGVERNRSEIVADHVEVLPKDSQPQPQPKSGTRGSRPVVNAHGVEVDDSDIGF